jgi:N,N'-diacetyllegionaminate synthase
MKTYIIAEVGPNHNGSFKMAMEYIDKLKTIGVNAIKFQISDPEKVVSKDAFLAHYQKDGIESKVTAVEYAKSHQLSKEEHLELSKYCVKNGVDYLCSAFNLDNLIFLDQNTQMPYFKIPSGEIFSLDIIDYISKRNKPVILSTGMATYNEIETAINLINENFKKDITVLHCVSNYPAPAEDVNLAVMKEIEKRFRNKVGFSDHTLGSEASIAAVALGARIIEKHVTLDQSLPGPDHQASSTIEEFKLLVKSIRKVERMLGLNSKVFSEEEINVRNVARKSIAAGVKIKKGEIITEDKICYKRPGTGFLPIEKGLVLGKCAVTDIEEDTLIKANQISL